ncbi:MAG: type II toxin-antitoxin system VapC family toxin [Candidatus Diapherotrites archaeon]
MKVLDTDFLIELFRGNQQTKNFLLNLQLKGEEITTTVFNYQETLFGMVLKKDEIAIEKAKMFFQSIKIFNYNEKAVIEGIKVQLVLRKKGKAIGLFDEMISGICIANNATLVTRNAKHFSQVPNLKIKVW